jgi:hypothetical protein
MRNWQLRIDVNVGLWDSESCIIVWIMYELSQPAS